MSLTERKIKYLEPGKSRQIIWDNGGFGVQVTPEGEKSFVLEYRFSEMTKMITLGNYPDMSLETARKQALMAMAMVMTGKDPEKGLPEPEKNKAEVPASQTPTFDKIREKTSEKLDQFKGRASEQFDKFKASETLGQFKEKATAKLDEIKQRVEKKATHTHVAPKLAENKIIRLDKKMRNSGEKPESPGKKIKKLDTKDVGTATKTSEKITAKKETTEGIRSNFGRVLDKSELKTLWSGLENSDMPPANQLAIKLLIVTAQRYEEVLPARWADFDLVSKWWIIPENFTKNGKKHKVPITELASELLRKIKELAGMSGVLFPDPKGATPIESKTLAEGLQRAQVRFGLKPFSLQDLQNSVVCQMLDNGISEATVYRLLNQEEPAGIGEKTQKVTDSDLRKALNKLERQLPKNY